MDILLEESTTEEVPLLLNRMIERMFGERKTSLSESLQKDLFFLLVMVLLKENGFKIIINERDEFSMDTIDSELFSNCKSNGVYKVTVFVFEFKLPLKLIVNSLGSAFLLNVIIEDLNQETYSVCLAASRYIVSPQASTVPMIFRDLKHLATTVKNNVISPVRSRVLSHFGYPSASLTGLPDELLFKIVIELCINDIINLSKTCVKINASLDDESLWHDLHKRDFDGTYRSEEQNWKESYKTSYLLKQKKMQTTQRQRQAGSMHDYMDYSDFVSYIDNPLWDIM